MEKLTRLIGNLSLALGIIAASLTGFFLIKPIPVCLIVALMTGLFGFISSSIYVMLNLRYMVSVKKINPGIISMFLSSAPVILVLISNAMRK
ncbi:MAG TPA: hypothetical protein VGO45_07370 [Bacteroidia bacterium]|jgi:hypothetical protein|nr:hypothetical protein [Bacteroidia bacterium]